MQLSRQILRSKTTVKVIVPDERIFELPERVLQFGTGMLLRGLPDYFIDKANRAGIFNGRIVVVKTTSNGDSSAFKDQDGLYTLCIRGTENGKHVEENIINSSISRVLSSKHEWGKILECAYNQNLQIIVSNTTEVGINLVIEDIGENPPSSYPGKLLAFLYERFKAFSGSRQSGFVIIPTELISDNGKKLKSIVIELAVLNKLENAFIEWLEKCNYFCSSLVDRIVTGMPDDDIKNALEDELGYTDRLITFCEAYKLWAIEGDDRIKRVLSFSEADGGMVVAPNIGLYRELKLRLLNGTHTLTCGIAILGGLKTVRHAIEDPLVGNYMTDLMQREIGPSIPYETDWQELQLFIAKVADRFRNPDINHYWRNIALNYSSKMNARCVPLLMNYYSQSNTVPELFALGFAAYIRYMKPVKRSGNQYFGEADGQCYLIEDEMADLFDKIWENSSVDKLVSEVLKSKILWGEDLADISGFQESVSDKLKYMIKHGARSALQYVQVKNVFT